MPAYTYPVALAVLSVFVAGLERLWPFRPQKVLRKALLSDLVHLVVNGHFLGVLLYGVAARLQPQFSTLLNAAGVSGLEGLQWAASWPLPLQIIVALLVVDFLQWCVHVLLHKSGVLWQFHQVHHSVKSDEMDWIVSFRFHWVEVVVYKTLLYLPLLPFGFSGEAMMVHAIFGTLIGHLNHANLNADWGPLRYVFNSPRMHAWHHDRDATKAVNFAIIFSIWDWLFRTARLPTTPPLHLGFDDDASMRGNFFADELWPLTRRGGLHGKAILAAVVLAVVVALPLWLPLLVPAP